MAILVNQNLSPAIPPKQFASATWNVGNQDVIPWEIARRRRQVSQMMKRFGQPCLIKHRYSDLDVRNGIAQKTPGRSSTYGQTRNADPLSFGTGYCSVELSENEWFNVEGKIEKSRSSPGAGWTQMPKYLGFGPSIEQYVIMPDREEDYLKVEKGGPVFRVENGHIIAPWYPKLYDGDLVIPVLIDSGGNVIEATDFYECKKVKPLTMRGRDRHGYPDVVHDSNYAHFTANRYLINQELDFNIIPNNGDPRRNVQLDR